VKPCELEKARTAQAIHSKNRANFSHDALEVDTLMEQLPASWQSFAAKMLCAPQKNV